MSREDDGVSPTGATDETPFDYVHAALFGNFAMRDEDASSFAEAVIETFACSTSVFRIASATDVAKVPTAEELAALQELVSNAPGFDATLDALTVVRAYLERVTE